MVDSVADLRSDDEVVVDEVDDSHLDDEAVEVDEEAGKKAVLLNKYIWKFSENVYIKFDVRFLLTDKHKN